MSEILGSFFASIFGSHSILATILIAMFPIIELKGAIPIGMSVDYWGQSALSGTEAFLFSLLGSSIVVPIIALIFIPVLNWLKRTKAFRKVATFIEEKVKKHSNELEEKVKENKKSKNKTLLKCFLVFGFVAIPVPLTGVWTGTCMAVLIGLKFWQILITVIPGNIVAGIIITTVCKIFPNFVTILSIIMLAIVIVLVVFLIVKFIMHILKKEDKNDVNNTNDIQIVKKEIEENNEK
ncbi:MAG: hypothetical protein E7345_04615 [Clostridiales bacterium]|nr:hypothetical protein [Clostridiales bacterium]